MAYSIEHKKLNRCNGELSLHVLDIIQTTMMAANSGETLDIKTSCNVPSFFNIEDISAIMQ